MKSRLLILILMFTAAGCVKDTYDMDTLLKEFQISPSMSISAVKGDITLGDLLEPNDTIVFDNDNFVRVVVRKDSVIDFRLADLYDLDDMVSFSKSYTVGELILAPFTGTIAFPINQISSKFTPPVTYITGTYPGFPSFPSINVGEQSITPAFPNFQYATFSQGTLQIDITNNLPVTIGGMVLRLYNSANHAQIGNDISVPSIIKGGTATAYLNLKDRTIPNTITVGATILASAGTGSPVQIDVNTTNIGITVSGSDMKVKSGRVILPTQQLTSLDGKDTIDFDPGIGIELDVVKIISGDLSYILQGNFPLKAALSLTLPSTLRSDNPISETIIVNPNSTVSGLISVNSSTINLGTITSKPYNSLPVNYSIEVSSNGSMVNFNSNDDITLDLKLTGPDFDYVKGYFGQETESIDADSFDLEIKDILSHMTIDFLVADPVIRLNYSNSFAIPIKVDLRATGISGSREIDLDYAPFTIGYPAAPAERDKSSVLLINKDNSKLPELISLPPEKVRFSGSAVMNPDGNDGQRNNYVFGNSRFLGSLEVEVPLEFRISNLQFSDTVDNFLKDEKLDSESSISPEDFEYVKILFNAENGFPVGISLSMSLYDPVAKNVKCTVAANDMLEPALVDNYGKVIIAAKSDTEIDIDSTFWNSVNEADEIIFKFTVNTTGSSLSKNIKIYSYYTIKFNAAVAGKANIKFQ